MKLSQQGMPEGTVRSTDVAAGLGRLNWIDLRGIVVAVGFVAAGTPLSVGAVEPAWSDKPVSYYASEQPLRDVLTTIVGYQGMKMNVSPEVKQTVSLVFDNKPASEAFHQLTGMNDLVWYFDGQVMFIYTADEVKTATIKLDKMSPTAFTSAVKKAGVSFSEKDWRISEEDGMVFLSGTQRFVDQVMELSKSLEKQPTAYAYKWKDSKGQTHYSSSPPEAGKSKFEVMDLRLSQTAVGIDK